MYYEGKYRAVEAQARIGRILRNYWMNPMLIDRINEEQYSRVTLLLGICYF